MRNNTLLCFRVFLFWFVTQLYFANSCTYLSHCLSVRNWQETVLRRRFMKPRHGIAIVNRFCFFITIIMWNFANAKKVTNTRIIFYVFWWKPEHWSYTQHRHFFNNSLSFWEVDAGFILHNPFSRMGVRRIKCIHSTAWIISSINIASALWRTSWTSIVHPPGSICILIRFAFYNCKPSFPFLWFFTRYLTHTLARFFIVSRPVAPRQWRGEWHGPFVHFRPVLTLSDFGGFLWTPLTTRWLKNWRWCPWWPPSQAARTRLDSGSELGSVSPRKCRHCRHMSRLR